MIELDIDNDGIFEISGEVPWGVISLAGTDPADADGDGLPDSWETAYGLSNTTYADAGVSSDADTLSNYEEFLLGTDPTDVDSDSDGMDDGWEVEYGLNPTSGGDATQDLDGDIASNLDEYNLNTDPTDDTSTPADLSVIKSATLTEVSAQTVFEYSLSLNNLGPGRARGVSLADELPPGTEILSVHPGILPAVYGWNCNFDTETLTCVPSQYLLPPEEPADFPVPLIAPAAEGPFSATATFTSTTYDYDSANDISALNVTVVPPVLTQSDAEFQGVGGVDGLDWPWGLDVSPDGKHVYSAGVYSEAVAVFASDPADGTLTFVEAQRDGIESAGPYPAFPRGLVVSPDGKHVYVTTEGSDGEWVGAVVAYSRDETAGALTFVAEYRDGYGGVTGIGQAMGLVASADGNNLYVTGPKDDMFAIFDRDSTTGLLSFVSAVNTQAMDLAMSPDDAYLYAAGGDGIHVFSRDVDGSLSYVGGISGSAGLEGIAVSADGKHLYTCSNGLNVYARNIADGTLTQVATYTDGEDGVSFMESARGLAVAPSGEYVYVTATDTPGSSLILFARDTTNGELRFVEVLKNGIGGISGILGVSAVTPSPDGNFIYVTASEDAVSSFRVDLAAER